MTRSLILAHEDEPGTYKINGPGPLILADTRKHIAIANVGSRDSPQTMYAIFDTTISFGVRQEDLLALSSSLTPFRCRRSPSVKRILSKSVGTDC